MKRFGTTGCALLLVLLSSPVLAVLWFNLCYVHQHCLPATLTALQAYAGNHDDRFPHSPKGFGDALALLVDETFLHDARTLCSPGDDGAAYSRLLASKTQESKDQIDIDENACTRIYVQGLRNDAPASIALIFDRYSTPGGDHARKPWGDPVREVGILGGGMITIADADWPAFARSQIQLLIGQGIEKSEAQKLYLMTGLTMADLGE